MVLWYRPEFMDTSKNALPEIAKKKQRSLDVSDHELTTYIAGQRVGPQLLTTDTSIVHSYEQKPHLDI